MLGVGHATIARELGITDRASEDRIKPVKRKIKEFFEHFDLFRVSCIYKGKIDLLLNIIREFYSVK
ncbi:TPA: traJ domain protein [Escherichia coli]|nr:traJ domain protein [Klebsiella pneumoniae]QKX79577.1 traJ domain protein [Escherichia coli]MBL3312931.1 traJ domain protein [Klebsiella pneumoniae]MBV0089384.1 traJ domain protein [Klebsiella pneumoniae]NAV06242.1 traJ domain protein [Klebsiella pneumoniae]